MYDKELFEKIINVDCPFDEFQNLRRERADYVSGMGNLGNLRPFGRIVFFR